MQAAQGLDVLDPGAQEQVVGIEKDDVGAEAFDLGVGQPLDRALAGHGHEGRGRDGPVRGFEEARPGRRVRVLGGRPEGGVHVANLK